MVTLILLYRKIIGVAPDLGYTVDTIEERRKKPSIRWDSNPQTQEFCSTDVCFTAVLQPLPIFSYLSTLHWGKSQELSSAKRTLKQKLIVWLEDLFNRLFLHRIDFKWPKIYTLGQHFDIINDAHLNKAENLFKNWTETKQLCQWLYKVYQELSHWHYATFWSLIETISFGVFLN